MAKADIVTLTSAAQREPTSVNAGKTSFPSRTTAFTVAPSTNVSATIRAFCTDQVDVVALASRKARRAAQGSFEPRPTKHIALRHSTVRTMFSGVQLQQEGPTQYEIHSKSQGNCGLQ
ncbi:hypothetical protein TG4357_01473 [Thalassovita gelatinovora]|uniref:Uncharacterized protein n=1 Tax=Thalassovita gelatinovora TaxID=53501 RepID=A0A0P1FAA8_THAGE|nr:hypothetical protein TG4357_01473 [Thalassovita gelatinovora]SEP92660.1 hypothetical protein SAMN04488043_102202 [Thalassovita gelatinovora]